MTDQELSKAMTMEDFYKCVGEMVEKIYEKYDDPFERWLALNIIATSTYNEGRKSR